MENPIEQMRTMRDATKSDLVIASYFLENPVDIIRTTLSGLAEQTKTSNTAIIRFCQKLGYKGFAEFKYAMNQLLLTDSLSYDTQALGGATAQERSNRIIQKYVQHLTRMGNELQTDQLVELAVKLCSAKRIVSEGYNRTGLPAQQLAFRLNKLGLACQPLLTDSAQFVNYAHIFRPDDLTVIFSIKGSHYYNDTVRMLKERNSPVALITMNSQTTLKKYVDNLIVLPCISRTENISFLDDQAVFMVYVELLVFEVAHFLQEQEKRKGGGE